MEGVKPLNIAGATIVVQICLLIIITLGVVVFPAGVGRNRMTRASALLVIVLMALASIIAVVFTRDFYSVWSPILGDLALPTFSAAHGLLTVFVLDIVCVSFLTVGTGGTKDSPFTSVLFLIPALAIFLREPPRHFLAYAAFIGVLYIWSLTRERSLAGDPMEDATRGAVNFSHGVVNITCLAVAMLTGYITRPVSL